MATQGVELDTGAGVLSINQTFTHMISSLWAGGMENGSIINAGGASHLSATKVRTQQGTVHYFEIQYVNKFPPKL